MYWTLCWILKRMGRRQVIFRDPQDKDGTQAAEQGRDQQVEKGAQVPKIAECCSPAVTNKEINKPHICSGF